MNVVLACVKQLSVADIGIGLIGDFSIVTALKEEIYSTKAVNGKSGVICHGYARIIFETLYIAQVFAILAICGKSLLFCEMHSRLPNYIFVLFAQ